MVTAYEHRSIPPQASLLGATGAVPFAVFTLALWIAPAAFREWARGALVAYGMVILSFVGALHWGFTMKSPDLSEQERWRWMGWSVAPAAAAWAAGMLPFRLGVGLLLTVFLLHLWLDIKCAVRSALPLWYVRMRKRLTWTVVLLLALALAAPMPG
jgi:hypothetical protein